MLKYSFNNWLREWADFGFDGPKQKDDPEKANDDPLMPLNVNYVMKMLRRHNIGILEGTRPFFSEVVWGSGPGSVKLIFSPYGGLKASIKRLSSDLEGNSVWVCKKIIEVKNIYDLIPDDLIKNTLSVLKEVSENGIDAPKADYDDLEHLVLKLAGELKGVRPNLLIYEGCKRVRENIEYIIHFGLNGMGVQAMGQSRIEEFLFHVVYDKPLGVIKIIGQEVQSPLGQHKWELSQSEWIEYYMPTQPVEEIIESQVRLLHSY